MDTSDNSVYIFFKRSTSLPCYFIKHKDSLPFSKMVSQTRLRSWSPRCAVGDKVPSFRDSEAAAVENAARNGTAIVRRRDPGWNGKDFWML